MQRRVCAAGAIAALAFLMAAHVSGPATAQDGTDWITKFPREPMPVTTWPGGKRVAVSFVLFVEEFGFGQGPVLRPDLAARNPDLVNEAFRDYAITLGNVRTGRLFKELKVPLSIVLNAAFVPAHPSVWKEFRADQPNAPIIAHGINNSNDILPLGRGLAQQKAYVRRTLDLIASTTGVRPTGWSSPSVYSNADTMQAVAAEGITYTIDQMDIRFHLPAEDAGRSACAIALPNRDRRHGPVSGAPEVAQRDRNLVGRLYRRTGTGSPAPTPRLKQPPLWWVCIRS